MKHLKLSILIANIIIIFSLTGSVHAGDMKPENTSGKFKLKLLWSRDFPDKIFSMRLAPDGQRCGVVTVNNYGNGVKLLENLYILDSQGKDIWKKTIKGRFHFDFAGNKSLLLKSFYLYDRKKGANTSYYNSEGEKSWEEKIYQEFYSIDPEGKYIGYSGILNIRDPSPMGWWELRDTDFNLLWKYTPKHNIDATVLSGGRTLMLEGRELKLYGKGGQELKKVVIPEIRPLPLPYQGGWVNPTTDFGPLYLNGTQDGRYAAFFYSNFDPKTHRYFGNVYSVDMEKGTWWSLPETKNSLINNVILSQDGRYLLLHGHYEASLYDNFTGKLLWTDRSGKTKVKVNDYPRSLELVEFFHLNDSIFIALNWVTYEKLTESEIKSMGDVSFAKGDDEQTKRKWIYFIDLQGKRADLFKDNLYNLEKVKRSGKYIIEMKEKRINKYMIVPEEN